MGRKGVSKRKPKKSIPQSSANINSPANSVQSLVKNNADTATRGGANPLAGTSGKNKK